jgi:hypothetical protein
MFMKKISSARVWEFCQKKYFLRDGGLFRDKAPRRPKGGILRRHADFGGRNAPFNRGRTGSRKSRNRGNGRELPEGKIVSVGFGIGKIIFLKIFLNIFKIFLITICV